MNADLVVQPIDEIRAAVETLAAGLGGSQVFSPECWDYAVTALARCHDQVGGDTRRELYNVFRSCDGPQSVTCVVGALEVLGKHLRLRPSFAGDPESWDCHPMGVKRR